MKNINILMSVNKKFLEHIEELIFSLLYYSSCPINIYLMYVETELNQEDLESISNYVKKIGNGKIIPILFDVRHLDGMPVTDNEGDFFGMEAYSRLFCAFKLPKSVEKILYLDADMICTGDITELYNIDYEDKIWVACRDNGIQPKDLERLELPLDYEYINSGMLLVNVKKLRENYSEKQMIDLIRKNKDVLIYPDQDFINKIFKDDIKIINEKYNLIAKDVRYKNLNEKPLIIHYAGSAKPWSDNVSRFDREYIEFYYEIMRLQGKDKKMKLEKLMENHSRYGFMENSDSFDNLHKNIV